MLTRKSIELAPDFFQLTFAETCLFAIRHESGESLLLFDCGLSAHVSSLADRLESLKLKRDIKVICVLSSEEPWRVAGAAKLAKAFDEVSFLSTDELVKTFKSDDFQSALAKSDEELCSLYSKFSKARAGAAKFPELQIVDPKQEVQFDSRYSFRVLTDGSTGNSFSIQVPQLNCLIASSNFAFYHPTHGSAPREELENSSDSSLIRKLKDQSIDLLCLPFEGSMSGELIRSYLNSIEENYKDLKREVLLAKESGVQRSEIEESVKEQFLQTNCGDPVYTEVSSRSLSSLLNSLIGPADETPNAEKVAD